MFVRASGRSIANWSATLGAGLLAGESALAQNGTTLASVSSSEVQGNSDSGQSGIDVSHDGRFVAFHSNASNLVAGDTLGMGDVFLRDRTLGTTVRVSLTSTGAQPDFHCDYPALTDDGRTVLFKSWAQNVVPDDVFGADVYLRDLNAGTTVRVPDIAGLVPTGETGPAEITGDGRYVVLTSTADNLVAGDTNGAGDVFVWDRTLQTVTRVSLSTLGAEGDGPSFWPSISDDGTRIAFFTWADNLHPLDTNDPDPDLFVHDTQSGVTEPVAISTTGQIGNDGSTLGRISGDGRRVVFESESTNLVPGANNGTIHIYLRDLDAGTTSFLSHNVMGQQANGTQQHPVLSDDGAWVAFRSSASNLAGGLAQTYDIFLVETATGDVALLSHSVSGGGANSDSWDAEISGDGQYIAFSSYAYDLVQPDNNFSSVDVFLHDRLQTPPGTYCVGKPHSEGCTAFISTLGTPSLTSAQPFSIRGNSVRRTSNGLFFYGRTVQGVPFQGGTLCAKPPLVRGTLMNSGGNILLCSGVFDFDFNAWAALGNDTALVAGEELYGQFWFRDPNDPTGFTSGFSNAIRFVVQP